MKYFHFAFLTYFLVNIASGCKEKVFQFHLQNSQVLDVPSASGLAKMNNFLVAVGDDAPFLFRLDQDLNVISRLPIYPTEGMKNGHLPKKIKPDFEALEFISETEYIIFGSGSKSPVRDIFILGNLLDSTFTTYNLISFYKSLAALEPFRSGGINIEGAAFHDGDLYLLNRVNSVIVIIDFEKFLSYVKGEADLPPITTIPVLLPDIKGIKSGFSGATIGLDPPHLIFTCSVENSTNAYDDGAILGSFIGIVPLDKLKEQPAFQFSRIDTDAQPVKVESVTVQQILPNNQVDLLLCTDSDGGESLIIQGRIIWKN